MNSSNKITIFRILLVIPFIILMYISIFLNFHEPSKNFNVNHHLIKRICFIISGIIFLIAMFTDVLDGYLARKNNEITTFGKFLDPLADKLMITSALLMLTFFGLIPVWITIIFILRDILINGIRFICAYYKIAVTASKWGKIKTIFTSLGIMIIFFSYSVWEAVFSRNHIILFAFIIDYQIFLLNITLIFSLLLSIYSGIDYFLKMKKKLIFLKKKKNNIIKK